MTDHSKVVLLLRILFVIYVSKFVFIILSCLFLAALWSPAGKGLTSWLSCVWCFLVFLSLSHMVSGVMQMWCLVVTCRERADLLALLCVVFPCVFVTFPYGVWGHADVIFAFFIAFVISSESSAGK